MTTTSTHESQNPAPVQETIRRRYNAAGCFTLIGTVVAPANRPNPDEPVSLAFSWLPLTSQKLPKTPATSYRHPNVVPALSTRNFRRLAPAIDTYVQDRGWLSQSVMYLYRPAILDELVGEDGTIKDLSVVSRQDPAPKRAVIDLSLQTELIGVSEELLAFCIDILEKNAGLYLPSYLTENEVHARVALNRLLADMPFLIHHIFQAYPVLHVLRHRGNVNGRTDDVINHIRYSPEYIQDIDENRLMRPKLIKVIA